MKYTRAQVLSFIDNTNPANGTIVALSDEPIRCDTWTEQDPEGNPVEMQWCPIPDGAADNYSEFDNRMTLEYAHKIYQNPGQSMIYFQMSPELAAGWAGLPNSVRLSVRSRAWVFYSTFWNKDPVLVAQIVEDAKPKRKRKKTS